MIMKGLRIKGGESDVGLAINCQYSDITYSIDFEPKSVKQSLYHGLSTKSSSTTPFSLKEMGNMQADEVEIIRRKRKELLTIQANVEDSLKNIYK